MIIRIPSGASIGLHAHPTGSEINDVISYLRAYPSGVCHKNQDAPGEHRMPGAS
ncbi:MAG: hypothetical protein HFE39_01545 [Clostridiales bacterium]|nr:hypothetical protein [Clostridiales bacterium]